MSSAGIPDLDYYIRLVRVMEQLVERLGDSANEMDVKELTDIGMETLRRRKDSQYIHEIVERARVRRNA